jgi:hypothetical protein
LMKAGKGVKGGNHSLIKACFNTSLIHTSTTLKIQANY